MAKDSIRDYSATNSENTDIQSIDISEGCSPAGINNAIREVMADIKDVSTGTVALETPSADQLNVDNLRLDGNTISSTDTNGNITIDPNGTGEVSLGGDLSTNGNDVNFGDNDKAIFGAGSDLQVYHNGNDSVVRDAGTGDLLLAGSTNVKITTSGFGETMAEFATNGAATLYHDNAAKLATSATGVSVLGDLSVSGSIAGAGKVLQVVSYRYPTAQTFSNVSVNSWQDTGVALAITPSSSSSQILVIVNVTGAPHYTGSNAGMKFRITRNGSNIVNAFGNHVSSASNGERLTPVASFTDYDNPSTTSSRTYRVQVTSTTTTSTLYVNRNYNHTGYDSSITLIEIGA